jgi:hypothetical protein
VVDLEIHSGGFSQICNMKGIFVEADVVGSLISHRQSAPSIGNFMKRYKPTKDFPTGYETLNTVVKNLKVLRY